MLSAAFAALAMVGSNLAEVRAGSITQTQSIPQTGTPINTNFNFNAYGGAAGTLTSVDLTVEEEIQGIILVYNFSSSTIHVDSATISAPVTVISPAGNTVVNASASITNQDVVNALPYNVVSFPNLAGTNSNSTSYTGAAVNPFYGTATVPVSISAPGGVVVGSPIGTDRAYSGSVTASVKVTLVYNFAAVPEPTSSAMFGIGIVLAVGLGWGRRRRELNKLAV
jgi:hypothetical protein